MQLTVVEKVKGGSLIHIAKLRRSIEKKGSTVGGARKQGVHV